MWTFRRRDLPRANAESGAVRRAAVLHRGVQLWRPRDGHARPPPHQHTHPPLHHPGDPFARLLALARCAPLERRHAVYHAENGNGTRRVYSHGHRCSRQLSGAVLGVAQLWNTSASFCGSSCANNGKGAFNTPVA
eukprot:8079943-Pyramimonas_sp.AAC.4